MKLNNLIKSISIIAGCITLALPATVNAAEGLYNTSYPQHKKIYLRADMGLAFPTEISGKYYNDQRPDSSLYYGVGAGYRFDNCWRTDLTLGQMDTFKFARMIPDITVTGATNNVRQKFKSTLLMLNGYYDVRNGNLIPYLTAGVGIAYNDAGTYEADDGNFKGEKKMKLAANAGVGLNVKIIEHTSVDFGYKYFYLNQFKTSRDFHSNGATVDLVKPAVKGRISAHTFTLGVRQGF